MGYQRNMFKIRKSWNRSPVTRPHSTPKGKKGYDRNEDKKDFKNDIMD